MTIREWLVKHLTDSGLWPDEAESILQLVQEEADKQNHHARTMVEVFHKSADGYPRQLFAGMLLSINHYAVAWIDAKRPQHWARSMFLD